MKKSWNQAFQIAAVYVGTVVGAGFATGKEIVEFFSRFGFFGFISILMSGYLFVVIGSKLMRIAAQINAKSYQEFNDYLFGKWAGGIINFFMLFMLLGVSAVMLAGAGAVFEEQLGLPKNAGVFITIFLSYLVMLVGTKGLFAVNTFVVPLMIGFSLILMLLSLQMPNFLEQFLYIPHASDGWKSVIAPFSYAALNLGLAQAVLVPIASEVKDDWTIKWGGILGGVALTVILIASHFTLIMLPNLELYEIPMAVIMRNLAPFFYWIFVIIIYGEIFTSVIGNVFGLDRQLKQYMPVPTLVSVTAIFTVSYLISLVNYGTLLSYLYPLFGYICMSFFILLWMKPFTPPERN
ncbi:MULTISPECIES: YkvI family membrane protein [Neobacillus]|uniref:GerAB/ArcD/ProY family transporter n=1 Tax=Neobacillus rhizophilus TaxID=2833579 RepID=A0A942U2I9_9BACI|nr:MULTISPECIES: GerAB/ArcD/ProY family transporter [Neobacillus]MBS4212045.1 GerAB/ArcD/ProY family transporter [Neobacillus rhizophilus]MBU8915476.1 GerAB/ArcD/ProY family transporter [Bacillus sp. FJAT-29953]